MQLLGSSWILEPRFDTGKGLHVLRLVGRSSREEEHSGKNFLSVCICSLDNSWNEKSGNDKTYHS